MMLYLSGPMTGLPDENRKAFNRAAKRLRAVGFAVVNPADLPRGWDWDRYMDEALRNLPACDGVALLPGVWRSAGARMEIQAALALRKEIMDVADWLTTTIERPAVNVTRQEDFSA